MSFKFKFKSAPSPRRVESWRGGIILIAAALLMTACADDSENESVDNSHYTASYVNSDDVWTYLSLESGEVVGTSPLGDADADAAWAKRMDWDIATCGDLIRTNGGTSGIGDGAIGLSNQSFDALSIPNADLQPDINTIEVW